MTDPKQIVQIESPQHIHNKLYSRSPCHIDGQLQIHSISTYVKMLYSMLRSESTTDRSKWSLGWANEARNWRGSGAVVDPLVHAESDVGRNAEVAAGLEVNEEEHVRHRAHDPAARSYTRGNLSTL